MHNINDVQKKNIQQIEIVKLRQKKHKNKRGV